MTVVHIGAVLTSLPAGSYFEQLSYAELALRSPLPRPTVLEKWRSSIGAIDVGIYVPKECSVSSKGPLRPDPEMERAIGWLGEAADALDAKWIVLPTGADVTTGQRDRDLLRAYFDRLEKNDRRRFAWAPSGIWEPVLAAKEAAVLGVTAVIDPLETRFSGTSGYGRVRGIGTRTRLSEGMMLELVDRMRDPALDDVHVVIDSARAVDDALRLRQVLEGA
jgi:hypothetical protein